MPYDVVVLPRAENELESIPEPDFTRISHRIDGLAQEPRPIGCQKLRGTKDEYRVRQGRFRILYRIDDRGRRVVVYSVADRKDAYR